MNKRVLTGWRLFLAQDWLAILLAAGLLTAGLFFIYSASWRGAETGIVGVWFPKQILWVVIGGATALALAFTDYHFWLRHSGWIYAAVLGLLGLVLVVGKKVYGAYRWLEIFGLPVQPSEMEVTYALILHGFRPVFRVTHLKPLENTQKTWRQLFYAPRQNIFVQNLEPYD